MNLCKPPDPVTDGKYGTKLERVRRAAPLVLAGTESATKSDEIKIGIIMLSHAGKEAREVGCL